jgi:hypothetical protein
MKRILIGGMLAVSLILLQPNAAPLAEEKALQGWTTEDGIKILRLWKVPNFGPRSPEIALMELSDKQNAELQENPLKFLQDHHIFDMTDLVIGQFSVRLMEPKAKGKDAAFVVAVHGSSTYSGVASFLTN